MAKLECWYNESEAFYNIKTVLTIKKNDFELPRGGEVCSILSQFRIWAIQYKDVLPV